MAKAKEPAAKASDDVSKSSASAAAAKASAATADAKSAAKEVRTAVSPSEMKKELEASAKPTPAIAKEAPSTFEVKDPAQEPATKEVPAPKPKETTPPPVAAQPQQRSTFLPLVLGGVVAAGLGFLASELDLLSTRSLTDDLRANLTRHDTRLDALEAVEPVQIPEVTFPALDGLSAQVTALSGQLADLEARLDRVESRPVSDGADQSQAAAAAYEQELNALQASVAQQRAEIEGLLKNALSVEEATAAAAQLAAQQSALSELTRAMDAGQPFAAALGGLADAGVTDLPAGLSDVAEEGVQTLNALQSGFPDQARAALSVARSEGGIETGFGGFLKRQLGARSVTPREGDDPDAVLSRAEAAVREGRLGDALAELDALPAPALDAMQDWLNPARTRQAAEAALQELSQSLSAK